jgi:hypothetical protein
MSHFEDVSDADMPADELSSAALLSELERRSAAYRLGSTASRPAEEMLADLKARQGSEKFA